MAVSRKISRLVPPIEFEVRPMRFSSIGQIYLMEDQFNLDPTYQRESTVWDKQKQQFFMDSLINHFDVPKLYIHYLEGNSKYKYAVIDGKQRLNAIWKFMRGAIELSDDFVYLHGKTDKKYEMAGRTYKDIVAEYPEIGTFFTGIHLPIEEVVCKNIDIIEEMFSRLNEAVPLNAPEKRNAFGGPVPGALRKIVEENGFFNKNIPFANGRYRYLDLACKFFVVEHENRILTLKKKVLDGYVVSAREKKDTAGVKAAEGAVKLVLKEMSKVFIEEDPLLKAVGNIVPLYWLFKKMMETETTSKFQRKSILKFDNLRAENREAAEADKKSDYLLLRFDEFNSSVNDVTAIEFKYAMYAKYAASWLEKSDKTIGKILEKEMDPSEG